MFVAGLVGAPNPMARHLSGILLCSFVTCSAHAGPTLAQSLDTSTITSQLTLLLDGEIEHQQAKDSAIRNKVISRTFACSAFYKMFGPTRLAPAEVHRYEQASEILSEVSVALSKNMPASAFETLVEKGVEDLTRRKLSGEQKPLFDFVRNCQSLTDQQQLAAGVLELTFESSE